MATYVYESIPEKPEDVIQRFEIQQSMKDAPLVKHPETGAPIRRVITGGTGFTSGSKTASPASGGSCHSGGGCGCH